MEKAWKVFTLFMAFLSVLCLAAYCVVEINGVHMGFINWAMMFGGTIIWVSFAINAIKKKG